MKSSSSPDRLSILTFNIRGFNNYKQNPEEVDQIVDFIKSEKPDIFCIQEFSAIKYKEFDDYPFWFKTNFIQRNKSVMAIFSKNPIVDKGYINFPNSSNGAIFTDIVYQNQIFRLYNIHLQSFSFSKNIDNNSSIIKKISRTTKLQKEQAEIIKNHTDLFKGKVILTRDFNSNQFSLPYSLIKGIRNIVLLRQALNLWQLIEGIIFP